MSALVPEDLLINDNNRRSWKQGVLICLGLLVAAGLIAGSIRLSSFEDAVESIVRIEVPAGVLADLTIETLETEVRDGVNETQNLQENKEVFELHPAGPARNILLVGTDSAVGLDSDDPAANRDRSAGIGLADTIMLVRLDPALPKASIMSLPRDLYVPIYRDGLSIRSEKLASALLVTLAELPSSAL